MSDQTKENVIEAVEGDSPYTPSELAMAQQAVAQLTPEQYLELSSLAAAYDEQSFLNEAGGVVWTTLYGPGGGEIHVTARAPHPITAAQRMFECVSWIIKSRPNMGWTPQQSRAAQVALALQPPEPPLPTITQAAGATTPPVPTTAAAGNSTVGNVEVIEVTSITKEYIGKHPIYKVRGGKYAKYGFPVFREKWTPEMAAMFDAAQVGVETAPPTPLLAWVDLDQKKVLQFAPPA